MFEDQKVRTIWVEGEEKWYFSIKDVVLVLADAKDPKDYLSKMRRREPELAKGWGQIVHPLVVRTLGGPSEMSFEDIPPAFLIKEKIFVPVSCPCLQLWVKILDMLDRAICPK